MKEFKDYLNLFIIVVLAILLATGISGADLSGNEIYSTVAVYVGFLFLVLAISLGAERSTEVVKSALRWLASQSRFLKWAAPNGAGSWILALLVTFAGMNGFGENIFKEYQIFNVDPNTQNFINIILIWISSNVMHNYLPDSIGKAQKLE